MSDKEKIVRVLMETAQKHAPAFAEKLKAIRMAMGSEFDNILLRGIEIPRELWMKWEAGKFDFEDEAPWRRTLLSFARMKRVSEIAQKVLNRGRP